MSQASERSAGIHAAPNAYGIVELDREECMAILDRQRLCIIAMVDEGEPYSVPVFYGVDSESGAMYVGLAEGRKTRVLDRNQRVCVVVTEVGPGNAWRSVMISGRADPVEGATARAAAVEVMMNHNRRPDRPWSAAMAQAASANTPRRHAGGRIVRIVEATITGRAKD